MPRPFIPFIIIFSYFFLPIDAKVFLNTLSCVFVVAPYRFNFTSSLS